MDKQVPIGVVVLDLNQSALTERCLSSLANGTWRPAVVVLVENGSADERTPELADLHSMKLVRLRPGRNLGCAGGRNLGLAYLCNNTELGTFMVLDNDTVVPPEFLERIGSRLNLSELAILAPVILDFTTGRVWSRGGAIAADGSLTQLSGEGELTEVVDWSPGACLIFSRDTWLRIGEFDGWLNYLFDDVEWCVRGRRSGRSVLVLQDIHLLHEPSQAIGAESKARVHLWARNGAVFRLAVVHTSAASKTRWIMGQVLSAAHDCRIGRPSWALARLKGLLQGLAEGLRRNRNAGRAVRSVP